MLLRKLYRDQHGRPLSSQSLQGGFSCSIDKLDNWSNISNDDFDINGNESICTNILPLPTCMFYNLSIHAIFHNFGPLRLCNFEVRFFTKMMSSDFFKKLSFDCLRLTIFKKQIILKLEPFSLYEPIYTEIRSSFFKENHR